MPEDRELASKFFRALEGGWTPYINDTYHSYKGYLRNMNVLGRGYDTVLEEEVDLKYEEWRRNERKDD